MPSLSPLSSLVSTYSIFWEWGGGGRLFEFEWEWEGGGVGWGGRLFEAGRLLTFPAFRMGAYSRWALVRGWVLIRINTVRRSLCFSRKSERIEYLARLRLFLLRHRNRNF